MVIFFLIDPKTAEINLFKKNIKKYQALDIKKLINELLQKKFKDQFHLKLIEYNQIRQTKKNRLLSANCFPQKKNS